MSNSAFYFDHIIEAARADGASELRIFHTIVMPISVAPVVTVFLYSFMWSWNDLLYSLTLIVSEDKRTVAPGLLLTYLNESNADWGGAMAASLMAALPVMMGSLTAIFLGVTGLDVVIALSSTVVMVSVALFVFNLFVSKNQAVSLN